jgi:hypothetical protein
MLLRFFFAPVVALRDIFSLDVTTPPKITLLKNRYNQGFHYFDLGETPNYLIRESLIWKGWIGESQGRLGSRRVFGLLSNSPVVDGLPDSLGS